MSALEAKLVAIDMGDHLFISMKTPGPCAGCMSVAFFFVNRSGRVFCVHCDKRRVEQEEMNARVTFKMMQGPVVIACRCPVSRDPSDLFKCTCEASYPENR